MKFGETFTFFSFAIRNCRREKIKNRIKFCSNTQHVLKKLSGDARKESARGARRQIATNETYICQWDKIMKKYRYC
jgi:hypothetical protein